MPALAGIRAGNGTGSTGLGFQTQHHSKPIWLKSPPLNQVAKATDNRIRHDERDHASFGIVPFEKFRRAVVADDPASVQAKFGSTMFNGKPVALSPVPLPIIYFDNAPSLSHMSGIIGVTLSVTGNVPNADGSIEVVAGVVAHLKCNIAAAISLRDALTSALLLAQPVENPEGKAN